MSNDIATATATATFEIGQHVYRLADNMQHGAPQEIAFVVGRTEDSPIREAWENKFGPGFLYRLRKVGGHGKGGATIWHESNLRAI